MFGNTNASWLFSVTDSSWENTLKHDQLSWCVWWKTDIDVIASTCFNRSIQDYQGAIRAVSRSLFRLDIATKYWNLQLQINDSIRLDQEVSEVRWDLRPIYHCLSSNYVLNIVRNEKLLPDGVKLIHLTVVRNCPLVPPWLISCYPALVGYLSENLLLLRGRASAQPLLPACKMDVLHFCGVWLQEICTAHGAEIWLFLESSGCSVIWGLISSYLIGKSAILFTWSREMDLLVCGKRHMGMKSLTLVC